MSEFSLIPTLAALIFAVAAGVFFWLGARARGQVATMRDWAQGSARILQARVEARRGVTTDGGSATTHYPVVLYEYEVNGQLYRNDQRIVGDEIGVGLERWALKSIAPYEVGRMVPVYYNPADPRQAVLERSAPANTIFSALAALFIALSLFMCAFNFGLSSLLDSIFGPQ